MDELERFKREISLAEVAEAHGYAIDRRESSRSSYVMRHQDGDKIVVATGEDGHGVFFSVHQEASGSVIDFVMRRRGVNLGRARQVLRQWLPVPLAFPTAQPPRPPRLPKPAPLPQDRAALVAQWHGLALYQGGYLEGRGLTPATLEAFATRLRTDARGNVACRHDDQAGLSGWELKNRGFQGFVGSGRKALFAGRVGSLPPEPLTRLAVTESALDAMSFYQYDPQPGLYCSFGGSLSPEQKTLLAELFNRYPGATVLAATDSDAQGESFAGFIQSLRPDTVRARSPKGKDWNDAVRPGLG